MKKTIVLLSSSVLLFTVSCKKNAAHETIAAAIVKEEGLSPVSSLAINTSSWTAGLLPVTTDITQQILPNAELLPLNVTFGGNKIFKSNNPEIFRGNGWLMQNSRTDATRGGQQFALTGTNTVYLFHINKSGAAKFIHLMVTNPNSTGISVSSKGSYYNNVEKPLTVGATGPSYFVAKDWLNNTLRQPQTTATSIAQGQAKEIFKIQMNNNNLVDGRFEITTTGNAYYYTVITSTGNSTDAINATQGSFAAGDYFTESANAYGREAGVYAFTDVNADNSLDIPGQAAHIGFALNTANKFFSVIENQTSAALMTMSGASSKTYGNYGHKYAVKFALANNNGVNKTVKLYFASNAVDATKSNTTWNGPIKMNGSVINVYTKLNAPRQQLSAWTVPPGQFNVTLNFFVPGLITTNQQLIFEVN
jgi:Tfp pilus assembly major pilin PilA